MIRFFPLTQAFFGLTSTYKKTLLEEIFVCLKHLNLSYGDVMMMPTYERRFFIVTLQNQITEIEEERDSGETVVRTGKNTRTRTHTPKKNP